MSHKGKFIQIPLDEYEQDKKKHSREVREAHELGLKEGMASSTEIKRHNKELMACIELHQARDTRFFEAIERLKYDEDKKIMLQAYRGAA